LILIPPIKQALYVDLLDETTLFLLLNIFSYTSNPNSNQSKSTTYEEINPFFIVIPFVCIMRWVSPEGQMLYDYENKGAQESLAVELSELDFQILKVEIIDSVIAMDSLTYFFDVFKSEFKDALPEIDKNSYDKLIETYDYNYKGYDSLVGVYERINDPFGKNKVLEFSEQRDKYKAYRDMVVRLKNRIDYFMDMESNKLANKFKGNYSLKNLLKKQPCSNP